MTSDLNHMGTKQQSILWDSYTDPGGLYSAARGEDLILSRAFQYLQSMKQKQFYLRGSLTPNNKTGWNTEKDPRGKPSEALALGSLGRGLL